MFNFGALNGVIISIFIVDNYVTRCTCHCAVISEQISVQTYWYKHTTWYIGPQINVGFCWHRSLVMEVKQ